jgi:hypothetical protein
MNMELAYRCQMLSANVISSRSAAERELLKTGWSQAVLESDIESALSEGNAAGLIAACRKGKRKWL